VGIPDAERPCPGALGPLLTHLANRSAWQTRPLGIAILILVVVRFVNRLLHPPPPFPATMSRAERLAATWSEYTMYALMFVVPLVGWGMLSAARYPIHLFGSWHLPFILPHDAMLHAVLRKTHTILAYFLFLVFLAHFGAILFHTLIVRDGILKRMAPWNIRPSQPAATVSPGWLQTPELVTRS
jgi:cytochrome b561